MSVHLGDESVDIDEVIDGFDNSNITSIYSTDDSSRFVIGTADNGLFKLRWGKRTHLLSRFANHPEWTYLSVQDITGDNRS